jgi:hypothetical protein
MLQRNGLLILHAIIYIIGLGIEIFHGVHEL